MISDLVVNISIMISFTFIWHHLFKHNKLTLQSSLKLKVIDGVIAGIFGVILMHYSLAVNDITILDLRHVAIAMVALYGGVIPAVIASAIVIIGRYIIEVNASAHTALFMVAAIGIGTGLIGQYCTWSVWKKWTLMLIYAQTLFTAALFKMTDTISGTVPVALYHITASLLGGYLVIYFARYIRRATDTFFEVMDTARKDPLTGLYNVRSFDYFYNLYLKGHRESGSSFSLIILDIDHFKRINDTFGHVAGDRILSEVAELIVKRTGQSGVVSRNGGEEFTVLFPKYRLQETIERAEEIRRLIDEHSFTVSNVRTIHITVSIGVADLWGSQGSGEDLYERADKALYTAKNSGRNRVCAITPCGELNKKKDTEIISLLNQ